MAPYYQTSPHLVLPGHRSIVNQTRFSAVNRILVTSGVEKIVKVSRYFCVVKKREMGGGGGGASFFSFFFKCMVKKKVTMFSVIIIADIKSR